MHPRKSGLPDQLVNGNTAGSASSSVRVQPPTIGVNLVAHFFSNFRWLAAGTFSAHAFLIVSTVYLARVLGNVGFGRLNFVQATVLYAMVLTDFNLPLYGMREIARPTRNPSELIAHIQALRSLFAVLVAGIGSAVVWFYVEPLEMRWLFVFSLVWLIPYSWSVDWAFRGLEKMAAAGLGTFLPNAFFATLVLVFVRGPDDLVRVPLYRAAGATLAGLILAFLLRRALPPGARFFTHFRPRLALYRAVLPLGLSSLLAQMSGNLGMVLLGLMDQSEVVGWYAAGYKLVMVFFAFNTLLAYTFLPQLSAAAGASGDFSRIFAAYRRVAALCSLALVLAVPFAPSVLVLLYGAEYAGGGRGFQLLLVYSAVAFMSAAYSVAHIALNRERVVLAASLMAAVITFALCCTLIPHFHVAGAAVALVVSESTMCGWLVFHFPRRTRGRASFNFGSS